MGAGFLEPVYQGGGYPAGDASGGGLYVGLGAVDIIGSSIEGNWAIGGNEGAPEDPGAACGGNAYGGGVTITNQAEAWISQTLISANTALGGNGADSSGGEYKGDVIGIGGDGGSASGGGLYFDGASLSLTDSSIAQNQATGGAGGNGVWGEYDYYSSPEGLVPFLKFVGNGGSGSGGGLTVDGGQSELVNNTFYGNSASGSPGGSGTFTYWAFDEEGEVYFINVPVVGSTGQGTGGGLSNTSGTVALANTIISLNTSGTAGGASASDIDGTVSSSSAYNLIGIGGSGGLTDGTNGNQVGVANPGLGPLGDYGGPTETTALLPGSPAIDAGSNALAIDPTTGQPLAYDQRGPGFPRILGHSVDIGAYEFTPLSQTISFGPLADQTYGVAPITLSATDTSDLPVSFTVLSGPATLSGSVLTVNGAGTVNVEASQLGNATYAAAVSVDESLTVNPAPLIVTATGESMTYGGTVPALNYTYAGLVNGDTSATFSGGLATAATSSSSVGGYTITEGNLAATGSYTIVTFNAGTLTVNAAPLTITPAAGQSMFYGAAVPTLTYTASGFVNGDPASLLTGELGTTATSTSVVGNYLFTLGSLTAGTNYALALAVNSPTFAVTPDGTITQLASSANPSSFGQAVTLTATVTANAPGSGSPTGTVTFYVGPVNPADQIGGTLSIGSGVMTASVSTSSLPVGTDTITATYSGDGDFLTSTGTLTITINQSIIVLDPSAAGALSLAGNACISVPGVVYVDSSSSSALSASGNAQVKAAVIDVHGKVQKSGNASFSPAPVTGAPILANPLVSLAPPSTSGMTNYGSESLSGNSSATIKPGIYSQISVSGNAKLTMSNGIYIIEGGGFSVSGNASVTGSGVMILNAGSNYPGTGGTYGSITLGGNGTCNLSPATSGIYAGIVFFQPLDNTQALTVTANASGITGTIYAPAAQLSESGNAALDASLIVDTLTISGNGIADGKDHYKRVTTERHHPTGGSCPQEGYGKGKLIRILFSVDFGGFRG